CGHARPSSWSWAKPASERPSCFTPLLPTLSPRGRGRISMAHSSAVHTDFTTSPKDERHQTSREQRSNGNETRFRFSGAGADDNPARHRRRRGVSGRLVGRSCDARVGRDNGGGPVLLRRSWLLRLRTVRVPVLPVPAVRDLPHRGLRSWLG